MEMGLSAAETAAIPPHKTTAQRTIHFIEMSPLRSDTAVPLF
jgi:hypothetical protein